MARERERIELAISRRQEQLIAALKTGDAQAVKTAGGLLRVAVEEREWL